MQAWLFSPGKHSEQQTVHDVYKFWPKSVPRDRFSQGFISKNWRKSEQSFYLCISLEVKYFQNNIILWASETEAVVSLEF